MLIAHVEQEGVWYIEGGMHALARKMSEFAKRLGVNILHDVDSQFSTGRIIYYRRKYFKW